MELATVQAKNYIHSMLHSWFGALLLLESLSELNHQQLLYAIVFEEFYSQGSSI